MPRRALKSSALRPTALRVTLRLALIALSSVAPCRAQASDPSRQDSSVAAPATNGAELSSAPGSGVDSGPGTGALARFLLERAKESFNRGVLEHDPAALESAFDVLNLGRTLTRDPAFLFNAARVARELGHCQEARRLYQRFIEQEPNGERRERAEHRLAELSGCDLSEPTEAAYVLPGEGWQVLMPAPWRVLQARALGWAELESSSAPALNPNTRVLLWSVVGAAGHSAALSGIFIAQAGSIDSDLAHLPETESQRVSQLQAEGHTAQTRARVFGAVAAGLGVGAALGFWWSSRSDDSPSSGLVLQASSVGAGASWERRF